MRNGGQPVQPGRQGNHGQHVERALRRHAEAGQRNIRPRRQETGQRGQARGGHQQGQLPFRHEERFPPQPGDQPCRQPGDHSDVQAGNRDQVRNARAAEDLPVLLGDSALVAHRQRGNHAGIARLRQRGRDVVADGVAGAFDSIVGGRREAGQAFVAAFGTNVAGGADALLQQPQLVV
jgi:hypothetical protein